MVPSAFFFLPTLPHTLSGKVNRQVLLTQQAAQPAETRVEAAQPRSELEHTLVQLWCKTLGVEQVSIHDNFFDMGGHSLLLAQVHSELQRTLGRELPIVELFKYPTISQLAAYLSQSAAGPSSVDKGLARAEKQKTALAEQRQRMQQAQAAARRRLGDRTPAP